MSARNAATFVVTVATLVGAAACRRNEASARPGGAPSGSGSAAAAAPSASVALPEHAVAAVASYNTLPFPAAQVASVVNAGGLPVYSGPTGSVRGKITLKGDPPPGLLGPRPPAKCGREALAFYEKAFRVGPGGELADALVAVTDYKAYIPPKQSTVEVTIRGCAFSQRTVVLTYGQKLDIKNLDPTESYLPHLEGARSPSLRVAIPQGEPVSLYPPKPGIFQLFDDLKHPWMSAHVFSLKYATAGVSDTRGVFKIDNLPVGKVKVSVFHPGAQLARDQMVDIEADKTTEVNVELTYHAPPPAASGSAAAPSPPGPDIH